VTKSGGYDAASFRAFLFGEGARGFVLAPPAAETLVPGTARGRLVGGCLSLIAASLGCREQLDARGAILLLEDVIEPPFRIDRMLTALTRAGVFDGVRGIVLGDFPACHPPKDAGFTLADVLRDRLAGLGVPVAWRFPAGHTARPALTLPLGVRVTLEATRRPRLIVDESPVTR
jgi:muramoyltetrapeptide carboxypeptidase